MGLLIAGVYPRAGQSRIISIKNNADPFSFAVECWGARATLRGVYIANKIGEPPQLRLNERGSWCFVDIQRKEIHAPYLFYRSKRDAQRRVGIGVYGSRITLVSSFLDLFLVH